MLYLQRIKAFTDETAIVEAFKGGKFSLFNGNIHGEYVQLVSKVMLL